MRPSRRRDLEEELTPEEAGLLPDDRVASLLTQATAIHKMFLAGLGKGLTPTAAAVRAGWSANEAGRVADHLMTSHPIVTPLVGHVLRLRELASLDGEDPVQDAPPSIH